MRLGVAAALVDGRLVPGDVEIADGHVRQLGLPPTGSLIAAPGFVDLQVNGFAGVDLLAADADGYARAGLALAATGVTAYQPTFVTTRSDELAAALDTLAGVMAEPPPGARILGAHLEGPFLSPARAGTHPTQHLRDPDPDLVEGWLSTGVVRSVTLAPELPGGLDLVGQLVAAGVTVSCGHTDADATTAGAAFDRGATTVTHLFNAMRPFHHRDPGIVGAAIGRPSVSLQLIVDDVHLAPEAVRLAWAAGHGRTLLVTDAIEAAGMPDGSYRLGEVTVTKRGAEVRRDDGTLAGSALTMDAAVRNVVALDLPVAEALDAASRIPARTVGDRRCGRLVPGGPADLVVLDDELAVRRVLIDGREVG